MGEDLPEIVEQIINAEYEFPSPYFDSVSLEAKKFISSLLVVNPSERMTAEQALNHPWLKVQVHTTPIS